MRQVLQLLYDFCFEQAAKAAKEAGFTYVAMGFGSSGCFHGEDWEKHLTAIDKTLTQNGLICVQTHLPYYPLTVSAEETDTVMDRAMLRCMEAGKKLGASRHVYHPRTAVNDNYSPRASLRYAKEAVKPLAEAAEKTGTVLCLENLPIFPDIHTMRFFTSDYEDLAELCDCFSPEAVRVCWDFGHANLMNNNQEKAIATMG
ncbi:MAG: sugar phosphate isomerase/epimerase, partial [Clostridia bacterium]|nr:sugar phosphate isomerase/epimerase [Clostridia bacterium]